MAARSLKLHLLMQTKRDLPDPLLPMLPVLSRLNLADIKHAPIAGNEFLADADLQVDLEKLHRSGFIQ